MRIADPLWMLGRQWQFGEFKGEDNGSPIDVRYHYRKRKANAYSLGNQSQNENINGMPLEARIEAMAFSSMDLRSKVRIGQQFERILKASMNNASKTKKIITDLRKNFPLSTSGNLDAKSMRFYKLMEGKTIDGATLLDSIKKGIQSGRGNGEYDKAGKELVKWYEELFITPTTQSAWQPKELAHKFKVHHLNKKQEKEFTLSAPDYQSGHLDWYSFDNASTVDLSKLGDPILSESLLPINVSFSSMPDKRLFSFEDSKIDLSKMDVQAADLIKLMLLDFSLVSGSDWFTIPVTMELGEVCLSLIHI